MTEYEDMDRAGTFKAKPVYWGLNRYDTGSIAVSMKFEILSQLEDDIWNSWETYAPVAVWGKFFIVKKDGTINTRTVEDLAKATGWNGDPTAVGAGEAPDCIVQLTVEPNEYKGVTTYEAQWINPDGYVHQGGGMSEGDLSDIQVRYGSLLRAAAAAHIKKPSAPAPERKVPKQQSVAPPPPPPVDGFEYVPPPEGDEDLPF